MNSDVSAVHRLLCAIRSLVRLSNSITAGARNSPASASFLHSSSSTVKVVGVPCPGEDGMGMAGELAYAVGPVAAWLSRALRNGKRQLPLQEQVNADD